ncbi:MAG: transposase [Acetobacteraceae bacterium]
MHTLVDALGNPIGFHLTGGEAHDLLGADQLLPGMQAGRLIADKAFAADKRVIEPLVAAGKATVIPSKANRRSPRDYDRHLYKARHLMENFSPSSSSSGPSPPDTTRPHATSSQPPTSSPVRFGLR